MSFIKGRGAAALLDCVQAIVLPGRQAFPYRPYPRAQLMGGQGIIDCQFGKLRSYHHWPAGVDPLNACGISATV